MCICIEWTGGERGMYLIQFFCLSQVAVGSIKVSNDSNCILSSCLDSCLRLLEKSTGCVLAE